jgi:hypothetical protein
MQECRNPLLGGFEYRDVLKLRTPKRGFLFYAYITTVGKYAPVKNPSWGFLTLALAAR